MDEHSSELSIGKVARQAGIRSSAIRYHESAGLLPAPRPGAAGTAE